MTVQVSTVSEVGGVSVAPKIDRAAYLANLLNLRPTLDGDNHWLQELRDRATARVQELAIPSTRDEEWRFTDLLGLVQASLKSVSDEPPALGFANLEPFLLPEAVNSCLVFVNGVYDPALSTIDDLPDGVLVCNLNTAAALEEFGGLLNQVASLPGAEEVFTALNMASAMDGALIFVPCNQVVDVPIHLLFVSTESGAISHPRVLAIAESHSKFTLVENYVSLSEDEYVVNPVSEIIVAENAEVSHVRVQRDSLNAFHVAKTAVSQARDSRYCCTSIAHGAKLSRHNLEVYQMGEQTETTLNGLAMIAGEQVADTHSLIAYNHPHGTSNQLHKCIVDDRAHAVFNGKILVPQAAQLTDARQLSKTLLLSAKARVDAKPQLEITANNVKCAHGATVSQLESDEVFYLQSRGIDEHSARKLLVYAFAYEVISQIPVESLKERLVAIARAQNS
jgi:Fe-S cluster assembly protein SufD